MRILVCMDGTEESQRILPAIKPFADGGHTNELTFFQVVDPEVVERIAVGPAGDPNHGLNDPASIGVPAPAHDHWTGRPVPGAIGHIEDVERLREAHSIGQDRAEAQMVEQTRRELSEAAHRQGMEGERVVVIDKDPAEAILRYANEHHMDAIAMTTHARGAVGTALHGSTAREVLQQSPRPVILIHPR